MGVTYAFDQQKKKTRPDEPTLYYMRCSYQGNRAKGDKHKPACKARATIDHLGSLKIEPGGEQHSCMPMGAQAREIAIEVDDMRGKIYERAALNPRESPLVSPDNVHLLQLIAAN